MPSTLKAIKTGPEPTSSRKIRQYLEKHVKPEAPYFSNEELLAVIKMSESTARKCAAAHLAGWFKRAGRQVWWLTPEHIKKL